MLSMLYVKIKTEVRLKRAPLTRRQMLQTSSRVPGWHNARAWPPAAWINGRIGINETIPRHVHASRTCIGPKACRPALERNVAVVLGCQRRIVTRCER